VIEVNSTFDGFHHDYAKMRDKTVLRNRKGWIHLLNKLQGPSLQGLVKSGEFEMIKISKTGESKISQTYKINPDGSYYVILRPGIYDVTFEGKRSQRFDAFEVKGKKTFNF
jgi:hypothetical protein